MELNLTGLADTAAWESAGIKLPGFNIAQMRKQTETAPVWVHFGAGNIFRGFIAVLQQRLLQQGKAGAGIVAVETFDFDIIDNIYQPNDHLTLNVILNKDATIDCEVIAAIDQGIKADGKNREQMAVLKRLFGSPTLQMASYTITEKGYAVTGTDGNLLPVVQQDIKNGPEKVEHAMSITAAMLLHRYQNGEKPIAMVSMDNCSHNGDKLKEAVLTVAEGWQENGFADAGFINYLQNNTKVSFPYSMIDKITPRPDAKVYETLTEKGVKNMEPVITGKNTYIAPFVNAERAQYLVVENVFPNGRPVLEEAGVILTDRNTVNLCERMKVTTCLNPLHTAMSVYGCLLGYTKISDEMQDKDIVALIQRLGYQEGLPTVDDPGVLCPRAFIDEVITDRLPNPFMPDAPQRIATDTSQKVGIRFGETIKGYIRSDNLNPENLVAVPLALAGWLRYLLGVDDNGMPMEISPDPLLEELQGKLRGIQWDNPGSLQLEQLQQLLSNDVIFGLDLTQTPLSKKIEGYLRELLAGKGAVRQTLQKHLV